ncbi:MAG TPA: hypothetical protein VFT27_13365, partial [Actinomycetota bacterium]|nr:hypothetical protein [Actinomycetota bacterium]
MRGTAPTQRGSVAGRATAAAAGLALVAALWGGFVVGRGTVPATQLRAPESVAQRDSTAPPAGIRPTGGSSTAGGDTTSGTEVRVHHGPHHRV